MHLIQVDRKSRVLTKARFGCLRDTYTVNVTRGCEFQCVYCYARGYPDAPPAGEVHLYKNLAEKLTRELDRRRRGSPLARVSFNTSSDCFQRHPAILDVTFRAMKALLQRGLGFSFLTKGWIPDRFIRLFSEYPNLVTARVGLVSIRPSYCNLFESRAASPSERLLNIERLTEAGIEPQVRVDPMIPFQTDDEESIRELFEALALRGVKTVSLSYLHLRPAVLEQLRAALAPTQFKMLRSCFAAEDGTETGRPRRTRLVLPLLRKRGYNRFQELSKEYGITPLLCACKNPDLPGRRCTRTVWDGSSGGVSGMEAQQLNLFS